MRVAILSQATIDQIATQITPEVAADVESTLDLNLLGAPGKTVGLKAINGFFPSMIAGRNVAYTVPVGKRVYLAGLGNAHNLTASSISVTPEIKVGSTYYPIGSGGSVSASTTQQMSWGNLGIGICLDAGEQLVFNCTADGLNLSCILYEFSADSKFYSVKKPIAAGETLFIQSGSDEGISFGFQHLIAFSGAGNVSAQSNCVGGKNLSAITLDFSFHSGTPCSDSNLIKKFFGYASNSQISGNMCLTIGENRNLYVNSNADAFIWVNVFET